MEKLINTPFIHLFETSIAKYLYDVNTDIIIEIPDDVYYFFKGKASSSDLILKYIDKLKDNGLLKLNRVQVTEHPDTKYLKYYLKNHLSSLLLQVTQNCNLRCEYCIYSGKYTNRTHSNKVMDFNTAKRGIDYLIEHSSDSDSLFLGFYGGEPLLEFQLIKRCMDYILDTVQNKKIYFNMTTNATLLTPNVVDELVNYDISILISLDGPKDIHDEARKFAFSQQGTFNTVIENLTYINQKYKLFYAEHIHFNTVLHQNDFGCVENYFKSDELLSDSFVLSTFITDNYALKTNPISKKSLEDIQYEKFLLFLFKLGIIKNYHPSKLLAFDFAKIGELRNNKVPRSSLPQSGHRSGPCIPGIQKLFLTVNGEFYPCERVNEMSNVTQIGSLEDGLNEQKIKILMNMEKYTEMECHNCWAYSYCTICLSGMEDKEDIQKENILARCPLVRNDIDEKFKDYCVLSRLGYDFSDTNEKEW